MTARRGAAALALAGVLLAAGEAMIVAPGIANIWARDPMAMINGARTLAEAFPRRFLLGIGVIRQDTGAYPPGWRPALLRNLIAIIGLVPVAGVVVSCIGIIVGIVSLILLFADAQRRTVMDFIASTFVVRTR